MPTVPLPPRGPPVLLRGDVVDANEVGVWREVALDAEGLASERHITEVDDGRMQARQSAYTVLLAPGMTGLRWSDKTESMNKASENL